MEHIVCACYGRTVKQKCMKREKGLNETEEVWKALNRRGYSQKAIHEIMKWYGLSVKA